MMHKLKPEEVQHGTPAGASYHKKLKERPCEPCRIARNRYERERRGRPIRISKTDLMRQHAFQSRVLKRLAELHPHDYKRLVDEEFRKMKPQPDS